MFIIICSVFIASSLAFDIGLQADFQFEFDSECSEYFVLQGKYDYGYFHRNNETLELWVTRNQSYEIYTIEKSDRLIFEWQAKTVNGVAMNLVLSEGEVTAPFDFQSKVILCDVYGVSTGTFITEESPSAVYKCAVEQWTDAKPTYLLALMSVLLVGSLFSNEPVRTLFRSQVSGIVQRSRTFLQRGESSPPRGYQTTSV